MSLGSFLLSDHISYLNLCGFRVIISSSLTSGSWFTYFTLDSKDSEFVLLIYEFDSESLIVEWKSDGLMSDLGEKLRGFFWFRSLLFSSKFIPLLEFGIF
jgi:hypothetical protein